MTETRDMETAVAENVPIFICLKICDVCEQNIRDQLKKATRFEMCLSDRTHIGCTYQCSHWNATASASGRVWLNFHCQEIIQCSGGACKIRFTNGQRKHFLKQSLEK